jgi:hypothetical protein
LRLATCGCENTDPIATANPLNVSVPCVGRLLISIDHLREHLLPAGDDVGSARPRVCRAERHIRGGFLHRSARWARASAHRSTAVIAIAAVSWVAAAEVDVRCN